MICCIEHSSAFFLHCELKYESSDEKSEQMMCCIVHNYKASLHYEWEGVSSEEKPDQRICHIEHICAISLHCEWRGASSDFQIVQMICCIANICEASLQNETTYAWSVCWLMEMTSDTVYKDVFWPSWLLMLLTCIHQLLTMSEGQYNIISCNKDVKQKYTSIIPLCVMFTAQHFPFFGLSKCFLNRWPIFSFWIWFFDSQNRFHLIFLKSLFFFTNRRKTKLVHDTVNLLS